MPWVKLDDQFPDHPKIDGLSDGAFRLHVAGMCQSARYLTDGLVPAERIPRLIPTYRPKYLAELVDRLLWVEREGVYEIHDFTKWNKTRDWWEKQREQKADRVRNWRAKQDAMGDRDE